MRAPHTSVKKGKRVRIKFRGGRVIVDKFVERTGKYIILEKEGRIEPKDILSFALYKRAFDN